MNVHLLGKDTSLYVCLNYEANTSLGSPVLMVAKDAVMASRMLNHELVLFDLPPDADESDMHEISIDDIREALQ